MANNITDLTVYVNFSKLQEYNESLPIPEVSSFSTIMTDIFMIFAQYTILQWIISMIFFVALFFILKKVNILNYTDLQLLTLTSFVLMAFNTLLLIGEIFTITQPLGLFILIWLFCVVSIVISRFKG